MDNVLSFEQVLCNNYVLIIEPSYEERLNPYLEICAFTDWHQEYLIGQKTTLTQAEKSSIYGNCDMYHCDELKKLFTIFFDELIVTGDKHTAQIIEVQTINEQQYQIFSTLKNGIDTLSQDFFTKHNRELLTATQTDELTNSIKEVAIVSGFTIENFNKLLSDWDYNIRQSQFLNLHN